MVDSDDAQLIFNHVVTVMQFTWVKVRQIGFPQLVVETTSERKKHYVQIKPPTA